MAGAFFGFTFLLAAFFPVGGLLADIVTGGKYGGLLKSFPPMYFHLLVVVMTYVPAALVTAWFFKSAQLRKRVPTPVPGASLMILGVVMSLAYFAAGLFASTVPGGGGSFVVMQLAPLVLGPARVVLTIGAVKFLLSASPSGGAAQSP